MFGKRCSLCGGKIVHGRCEDCGLDATKNDSNYKLNQSSCDTEALTHSHSNEIPKPLYEPEEQFNRETTYEPETFEDGKYEQQSFSFGDTSKKKTTSSRKMFDAQKMKQTVYQAAQKNAQRQRDPRRATKLGLIITVVIIVLSVLAEGAGSIYHYVTNKVTEVTDGSSSGFSIGDLNFGDDTSYLDDDTYEYVTYDLSETGDTYGETLSAGYYKVGVDIPEGTYSISAEAGEGTIHVNDSENGIYIYESLAKDSEYTPDSEAIEDIRLYQGAYFEVTDGVTVVLQTDNAQLSKMKEKIANPLTETVTMDTSNGAKTIEAGVDFEAGVYDITVLDGYGIMEIFVPGYTYEDEEGEEYSTTSFFFDTEGVYSAKTYKNVVLPKGTRVGVEDAAEFEMAPSAEIESTDYETLCESLYQ